MDLPHGHKSKIIRADCCLQLAAVLHNIFLRVPFRKAEVQERFTVERARTARARAESVNQPGQFRKRSKLQNLQTVGLA